ncbi:MAG TPA: glycosyl hydrolase family 18 protein, partial [Christiangramia sp.]|nr:glycosyl hydrolase family 18 protein [Christiangramia sp.]
MRKFIFILIGLVFGLYSCINARSGNEVNKETRYFKQKANFKVIGYWTGSDKKIDPRKIKQLDQIIYSFLHLKRNSIAVLDNDAGYLKYLVSQKKINPELKVLVAFGGWGGCETCSDVFTTEKGRNDFAISVKETLKEYNLDGIDLDWEYPAISGYQGHNFKPEDRENFTLLVKELRDILGQDKVITFAAGGFRNYLEKSIEWNKVMPLVDHVNLMSYDMVGGGSSSTGHHTSLFSTKDQKRSADEAIKYLDSVGIPSKKIVLGAAFYARVFEDVGDTLKGLYQPGKFREAVLYKDLDAYKKSFPGFEYFWD